MTTLLLLATTSFGLGMILTPLIRRLALRVGLVDPPDQRRKMHAGPIPVAGGVAVFLAAVGSFALVSLGADPFHNKLDEQGTALLGLLLASLFICGVGLLDDYRAIRGRHKLFGQLIAVGIVMGSGVVVQEISILGWHLTLGPLALPFTALWLLGAINSLNLIDGMDGLLGSVGVIICLAMAVLAVLSGQWAAAAVACALAGALLAFLCFNFPPASIFLGDSGSMLVGLVIGTLAIECSLKGPAAVALAAPTALLTIPIFDTLAAILRRKLTGRSIYSTDRGHIHHCLLRYGFSAWRVLLLVWFLCLLTVVGALASLVFKNELLALVAALTVINILVVKRLFGHAELALLRERLLQLWKARSPRRTDGQAHQLAVHLQGSADWHDLWDRLTARASQMALRNMCLDVNAPALHEGYHARWDRMNGDAEAAVPWRAEIPLVVRSQYIGRLEITGDRGAEPVWATLTALDGWVEEIEAAIEALTVTPVSARVRTVPPPPSPIVTEIPVTLLAEQAHG